MKNHHSALSLLSALALGHFALPCLAGDLPVTSWQGRTMGSDYTVKIVNGRLEATQIESIKSEIEKVLVEMNRQMSNYQPDSELSRFNRAAANEAFKVSPDFAKATRFSLELSRKSDGAFDPTLGTLINLWGFGETAGGHAVPTHEALAAAMAEKAWSVLLL